MKKNQSSSSKDAGAPIPSQVDLIYQTLETEMGGVEVYTTALTCVQDDGLRREWTKYLEQTKHHVEVVRDLCSELSLDPDQETPGRQVVRNVGKALVKTIQLASGAGDPAAAEIVAAECVTLAETKDHANWSLIGKVAEGASGKFQSALQAAYDEVEDEEDEHLYHTRGWARELWIQALGLPAQLPPPEEEKDVHSEEEALHAKNESRPDED